MLASAHKRFDPVMALLNSMIGNGQEDVEIETGVYSVGHHNFGNSIFIKDDWPKLVDKDGEYFGSFGVCDSLDQVFEQCPMIKKSDTKYCISLTEVTKDTQSPEGGWRWHKWGSYIGNQNPTTEYLYDEPEIKSVYCYSIYAI